MNDDDGVVVSLMVSRRFDGWVSAHVALAAVAGPLRRLRPPFESLMRRRVLLAFDERECARKAADADVAALDLSAWRLAFNGSEPVTPAAVEAFSRRFEPCGFRRSALLPCYGLVEDTLCATSRRPC